VRHIDVHPQRTGVSLDVHTIAPHVDAYVIGHRAAWKDRED
jgi:hypothetical protein